MGTIDIGPVLGEIDGSQYATAIVEAVKNHQCIGIRKTSINDSNDLLPVRIARHYAANLSYHAGLISGHTVVDD